MAKKNSPNPEELEGELANATLWELRRAFGQLNYSLFDGALQPPVFRLGESRKRLGLWEPKDGSIEISKHLLLSRGWGAAIEVLKHEMAHQFVSEVLKGTQEAPHGPVFRKICRARGIDERAAGDPAQGNLEHPVLDKVRKLLSLAQSSNQHEAEAAAQAAQRLMLKYNIDQLDTERDDGFTSRQLGRTTARASEAERLLGAILQHHFFVDVIWVGSYRPLDGVHGRVLEVCGRIENVELAAYVYDFVTKTADRLWAAHKKNKVKKGNRDRRAFLAGVMSGFLDQLNAGKKEQAGRGLIWRDDPELKAYVRRRHPSISKRYRRSSQADPAHAEGRIAGRKIVLHRGIKSEVRGNATQRLPRD